MKIKPFIHDICFKNPILKKFYCYLSFSKKKLYYWVNLVYPILKYKARNKKAVFLIFTPEHGNLGDHAIAYSEKLLLSKIGVIYYEVTVDKLQLLSEFGFLHILNCSLILVSGGGNLGTLWPKLEILNRQIISKNPNSYIFILPNSIYYDEEKEFEKSKKIYNAHDKLYLYAREILSYNKMKNAYQNVKLIPDMALFLNEEKKEFARSGCLLILRNDVERTLSNHDRSKIVSIAKTMFSNQVTVSDTVLDHGISVENRENELRKKFDEFRKAELVITDRLHGMIFAAITATNCIVLDSKSPKLKGCYQWISKLGYIKFLNDIDSIDREYNRLKGHTNLFDNYELLKYLKELEKDVIETVKKI